MYSSNKPAELSIKNYTCFVIFCLCTMLQKSRARFCRFCTRSSRYPGLCPLRRGEGRAGAARSRSACRFLPRPRSAAKKIPFGDGPGYRSSCSQRIAASYFITPKRPFSQHYISIKAPCPGRYLPGHVFSCDFPVHRPKGRWPGLFLPGSSVCVSGPCFLFFGRRHHAISSTSSW